MTGGTDGYIWVERHIHVWRRAGGPPEDLRAPWRNLWAATLIYALTNVAVGQLLGQ